MANKILVTGATGKVGGRAISALAARGEHVRAAVRDPQRAAQALPRAVEVASFNYERPETFTQAFADVNHILLIAPPGEPRLAELLAPAVDAAAAAGVEHLVFISAMGVDANETLPLRQVERRIEASGIPHTILRPNWYMQNLLGFLAASIKQQGAIYLPAGDARTSFIDTRDVGDVAAVMLSEPGHMGKTYTLTGPQSLTYDEVAAAIAQASGRPVQYVAVPEEMMREELSGQGWPGATIDFMLNMYRPVREGRCAAVTSAVADITGRPPIRLEQFVRENASVWSA